MDELVLGEGFHALADLLQHGHLMRPRALGLDPLERVGQRAMLCVLGHK